MSGVFLRLLNISITAGWIVLIVVLLRFVLKKAPKWIRVVLWGLVALRLLLPVSIESVLSLVPSAETVKIESVTVPVLTSVSDSNGSSYFYEGVQGERVVIQSGVSAVNSAINPVIEPKSSGSVHTVAILKSVAGWVWLFGAAAMLLYALVSYLRLKHKVRTSVKIEKGVYVCDEIGDPFILGLIVPKVCLPSGMDETTRGYVLAHEKAHLKRFDHIWKPLGFLLLAVYWFNPLLWLAYILLCRDIELACDEKVVKEYDAESKAAYSEALVKSSDSRRSITACPLAFGETGVKSRVKSILNYKKPAFWIIVVALLAGIVTAVCFLTVPKKDKPEAEPDTTPVPGATGKVLEWLNYRDAFYELPWDGDKEMTIDVFPNVTFRWSSGSVEAIEPGKTRTLFTGMPIFDVFFTDVTGDGKPELCASVMFGSGMIDMHVIVYDYANKQSYTLWDRGKYDYQLLTTPDGVLYVEKRRYGDDKSTGDGTLMMQDGLLCCRWSDGSVTVLNRELHESELYGEWLVREETDNDGNVLYQTSVELWKEYHFKEDGTVTYNETVPVSSDYEKAFGHPVTYPYEVHNDYVYIAGDDTSGAFRWGQYDRDTRTLTLMHSTDAGTVYAKLRRMGEDTQDAEKTYVGEWELAKIVYGEQEYGSEFLSAMGIVKDTFILNEDGTGSRFTETGDGSQELSLTFTADYDVLKLVLSYGDTFSMEATYDAVYDPQKDTLTIVEEYESAVYVRKGSVTQSPGSTLTLDRLVGVWETDSDDELSAILSGTFVVRENGIGSLTITGGFDASSLTENYPVTLDGNLVRLAPYGDVGSFMSYDPNTDTLSYPIINIGMLIFKRTDKPLPSEEATSPVSETLDEATLCTVWTLTAIEAPNGSRGDPKWIQIEQYFDFRPDGSVHFIERNGENYSQATAAYTLDGNTVTVNGFRLVYDPENHTLLIHDPHPDDIAVWIFSRTPDAKLPIKEAALVGTWIVKSIDLNGTDVTHDEAYRKYRDLTIELYRSGTARIYGADERWSGSGFTWIADDEDRFPELAVNLRNEATGVSCFLAINGDYEFNDGSLSVDADFLFAEPDPDLCIVLKRDPVTPLPSETILVNP